VEAIIEEFAVPEEIAAVTLIAFGSSAPEILLNTISAANSASSLSLPALLGSGHIVVADTLKLIVFVAIIAFGLIPSVCILYQKKPFIELETGPIIREVN
jgi:Ca2+/Na+ antiporter